MTYLRTRLRTCARSANEHHKLGREAHHSLLKQFKVAGDYLLTAKRLVKKLGGSWREWAQKNLDFSLRTAQNYMRISKRWDEIKANPDESLRQTLDKLAAKRSPQRRLSSEDFIRAKLMREILRIVWKDWTNEEVEQLRNYLAWSPAYDEAITEGMEKLRMMVRRDMGILTRAERRQRFEPVRKTLRLRLRAQREILDGYEEQPDGTLKPRLLSDLI